MLLQLVVSFYPWRHDAIFNFLVISMSWSIFDWWPTQRSYNLSSSLLSLVIYSSICSHRHWPTLTYIIVRKRVKFSAVEECTSIKGLNNKLTKNVRISSQSLSQGVSPCSCQALVANWNPLLVISIRYHRCFHPLYFVYSYTYQILAWSLWCLCKLIHRGWKDSSEKKSLIRLRDESSQPQSTKLLAVLGIILQS